MVSGEAGIGKTRLLEEITPGTTLVATSLVQSATGEIAALDEIVAAARAVDALVVVDGSQAVGWLPADASQVDAFACVGYKWLMSPRGSAFLALSERLQERLRPTNAGWYAGADIHTSYYGPPLRLATDEVYAHIDAAAATLSLADEPYGTASGSRQPCVRRLLHMRRPVAAARPYSVCRPSSVTMTTPPPAGPRSPSPTGCPRSATPTRSPSSTAAASSSWARTTSWSPAEAGTPPCWAGASWPPRPRRRCVRRRCGGTAEGRPRARG